MTGMRRFLLVRTGFLAVLCALGVSVPVSAQTAGNRWGVDYEGKAITAVFPLAGEEAEMIRRFHGKIMESVAALGKYSPREADIIFGTRIPTDMPPLPSLTGGARYALTGGVYPGDIAGEHYLQLWLWDMAGSTMIYTDDLVYDDINEAMESVPGLVEWLFSHIHELTIETPASGTWPDPLFILGVRAGLSQRWYVKPNEQTPGAFAPNLEGGVSGALRLNSLFSIQLELLLTGDTLVYRGLEDSASGPVLKNKKYTNLSLEIPVLCKMNFRAGNIRLSPLAGIYVNILLGQTTYRDKDGKTDTFSWSVSNPLGFTAGLEGAAPCGPGMLIAGLRYGMDFGAISINGGEREYRRNMVSLYLGYEFGFFEGKKLF
ncbi:MAG: PorT family protein [Spirochaetaceae bacterium]|jgi:hypothetical protein|nr:PorT family protein [Spirochaetaceae bacterium]